MMCVVVEVVNAFTVEIFISLEVIILTASLREKKVIIQTLFASTIRPLVYRTFVLAIRFPYVKVQIKPLKLIELHCIKRSWA